MYGSTNQTAPGSFNFMSRLPGIIGGVGDITNNFFKNQGTADASQAAMDELNKIPGYYDKYLQPYNTAGQNALKPYQSMANMLTNNPMGFVNNIYSGFQKSPYYDFLKNEMQTASNNSAAAGGTLGTGAHQFDTSNLMNNLASGQMQQYFNNVMQPFQMGMGAQNNLINYGQQSGYETAEGMRKTAEDMANMAAQRAAAQSNTMGGLFGGVSSLASNYLSPVSSVMSSLF